MDLGSVAGNVNGSPSLKELRGSKQDRSGFDGEDCLQQSSKLARTTLTIAEDKHLPSAAYSRPMLFHQGIPLTRSASLLSSDSRRQEHMLSFSDKPEAYDFTKYVGLDSNKNSLSPFLHQLPPPYCRSSGGGGYGSGGMMSMQGKGPFTLTQWAELEQQALIYKYITANVPVPSSLLISIQKSFYPYGSLPPSSFGWGTFHLGFAGGNMDPEPGRCRRTDGKKWRCSKDAVPDQKYCERHINRGRHRSRKPVEVQPGLTPAPAPSKAVASRNRTLPTASQMPTNRVQNAIYPSIVNLQPKEERNNNIPFGFGHVTSPSLLTSSYLDNKTSGNHSHNNSWPEELKSDWTQLSMSIPVASSSSPSSTAQEKATLSPLRLSREFDLPIQSQQETLESVRKVNTWIPISWGNSLGGPLGEVLNNNSTTSSPTLGSSPTGVLQKSTFCSLSNSSSVSSPIAENNRNNNVDYFHYTT